MSLIIGISLILIGILWWLKTIFFPPTFACTSCKEIHQVEDVKDVKGQGKWNHTRKDGGRDRRFNQSMVTWNELFFECKSCGKEFTATHSGRVKHFEKIKDEKLKKDMKAIAKSMDSIADQIKKGKNPFK